MRACLLSVVLYREINGKFVVFQAVCQGEGDWRHGPETDRTLLRSGPLQRTPSLQVIHTWTF